MSYKYLFRIIILGHPGVGKSSLLTRLCDNICKPIYQPTIGIDFGSTMTYLYQESKDIPIKSHLWDTAGQEYFSPIIRNYYRDIAGAILIFDITHKTSFERLTYWLNELKNYNQHPDLNLVLVGNKTDLNAKRIISNHQAQQFADKHHMKYYEVSVKNNIGISDFYYQFIKQIYETIDETKDDLPPGIKEHVITRNNITDLIIPPKDIKCCPIL